jgi:hypothetical protein
MARATPIEGIKDYAAELANLSNYTDQEIKAATRILATFPQISDEMMQQAMKTMVDFAAFADTSLDHAAIMVGKASMGMTAELMRSGISFSEATKQGGNFVDILKEMNQQIGGQALASVSKVTLVKKSYAELQEQVGRLMEMGYTDALDPIIKKFKELAKELKTAIEKGELDDFIQGIAELAEVAKDTLLDLVDVAKEVGKQFKEIGEDRTYVNWLRDSTKEVTSSIKWYVQLTESLRKWRETIAPILDWPFHFEKPAQPGGEKERREANERLPAH